jgi:RNA-binding protein
MVTDLSPTFKKTLFLKAQSLKPVVRLGKKGLTESVHQEIHAALEAHELVKIKISGSTPEDRMALYNQLAATHNALQIQIIGHIIVLYRKKSKPN